MLLTDIFQNIMKKPNPFRMKYQHEAGSQDDDVIC